jgi:DNA recombination protein RmuC
MTFLLQRSAWLIRFSGLKKELQLSEGQLLEKLAQLTSLDAELAASSESRQSLALQLNQMQTEKSYLESKLTEQKTEMTDLHKQLYAQFENMANSILDRKSEKFSKLNEEKIKGLIEPLGKDIEAFKQKVTEEAKERFSLGEKVKELVQVNAQMSEVAINLTKALKGESKTQGNWGEMILESILEKSGLRKDEQYFMEHQLQDRDGKALRSESEGKKMRPDALIKYPDDRNVIVDSKVSLTAFARAIDSEDETEYDLAISQHLLSIKGHITALSTKGYDDYSSSLDFVLMFVPSEPAYIAAMQADPDLWNYAYDRRILLQSPTNLITSLKLIEELWKRESHNQNAQAIAERGAKLYDKFVSFVENLEDVGSHLDKAKQKYEDGFKQLSSGRGNLIRQAEQLKSMVGKTKKELPQAISYDVLDSEESQL